MRVLLCPLLLLAVATGTAPENTRLTPPISAAQTVRPDAARAAKMRDHFDQVMRMHTAVIRGDLNEVATVARGLLQYQGPLPLPDGSERHVAAIREAAGQVSAAKDVVSAAFSTAVMLSACGDCHRAVGTMPSAPLTAISQLGGVVGHMLAHQRAADQMLQGLVVPSNTLWREGTKGLVSAPMHPKDLPVDADLQHKMAATEERIHRVATDAYQAADGKSRAGFYAQVLAGCADCHRHGKSWGPKLR